MSSSCPAVPVLSSACLALLLGAAPATAAPADVALRVDPLLLAQAHEVWRLASSPDNPLWPGWSAADTPLLIYLPGVQDVLVNHPDPPDGFVPVGEHADFPGWQLAVRDGETVFELDGQNTSTDIAGLRCLVVADTLSNRRNNAESWVAAGPRSEPIGFDELASDPYDQLALVAHEAFHVHQDLQAPGKGASEFLLMQYPVLSVDNNAGFALEGAALADALAARDDDALRAAALRWLATRAWRRELLPPPAVEYEDGIEFSEGLAKYVEYRLFEVLEGREHAAALRWAQGFHGYADLSAERARLVEMMQRHMRGEVNVNNAPYGTAPLRMRLYWSGMALGALLDRLGADWKHDALQTGRSLTDLMVLALQPRGDELRAAMDELQGGEELAHWRARKTELAEAGAADLARLLETIERGPATALVVDCGPLGLPGLPMSFTPFGIRKVDEARTVFGQIPLSLLPCDGFLVRQTRPSPLLQDSATQRVTFQLQERVDREALCDALGRSSLPRGELRDVTLSLPGVELQLARATLTWEDGRIEITLLPAG